MTALYFNSSWSDDERREQLYRGEMFVYTASDATRALCTFAREQSEEAFAPHDPREAQHHLSQERYVEILAALKPKFINHPRCKELIRDILRDLGCDLAKTFFDVPRRIVSLLRGSATYSNRIATRGILRHNVS